METAGRPLTSDDPGGLGDHWHQYRVATPLALWSLIGLLALLLPRRRPLLGHALGQTWGSVRETLLALGVLMLVLLVCLGILAAIFAWLADRPWFLTGTLMIFLAAMVWINSYPIVYYHDVFQSTFDSPAASRILSLVFANALLYYFVSRLAFDLWRESRKLYVQSAAFKDGTSALHSLFEKATHALLDALSPAFYYLFSFTFFTDHSRRAGEKGIVSVIFEETRRGLSGGISEFLRNDFGTVALYLIAMMAFVLTVRFVLDLPRDLWRSAHLPEGSATVGRGW